MRCLNIFGEHQLYSVFIIFDGNLATYRNNIEVASNQWDEKNTKKIE